MVDDEAARARAQVPYSCSCSAVWAEGDWGKAAVRWPGAPLQPCRSACNRMREQARSGTKTAPCSMDNMWRACRWLLTLRGTRKSVSASTAAPLRCWDGGGCHRFCQTAPGHGCSARGITAMEGTGELCSFEWARYDQSSPDLMLCACPSQRAQRRAACLHRLGHRKAGRLSWGERSRFVLESGEAAGRQRLIVGLLFFCRYR